MSRVLSLFFNWKLGYSKCHKTQSWNSKKCFFFSLIISFKSFLLKTWQSTKLVPELSTLVQLLNSQLITECKTRVYPIRTRGQRGKRLSMFSLTLEMCNSCSIQATCINIEFGGVPQLWGFCDNGFWHPCFTTLTLLDLILWLGFFFNWACLFLRPLYSI